MKTTIYTTILLCFFAGVAHGIQKRPYDFFLRVHYRQAQEGDSLQLELMNLLNPGNPSRAKRFTGRMQSPGLYEFKVITADSCGYFAVHTNHSSNADIRDRVIVEPFFWEAGDSVVLVLANHESKSGSGVYSSYQFSGKGADKYNYRDSLSYQKAVKGIDMQSRQLLLLKGMKAQTTPLAYGVMLADLALANANRVMVLQQTLFASGKDSLSTKRMSAYLSRKPDCGSLIGMPMSILLQSRMLLPYMFKRAQLYTIGTGAGQAKLYDHFNSLMDAQLRDRALLYYFCQVRKSKDIDSLMSEASTFITEAKAKEELRYLRRLDLKQLLTTSLQHEDGSKLQLKEFAGKIVVVDFWTTGCGACAVLFKNVLSKAKQLYKEDKGIVFVSINADRKEAYWKRSLATGLYTSAQAINLHLKENLHPLLSKLNIQTFPTLIVFDGKGQVAFNDTANLYGLDSFLAAIASIKQRGGS